MRRSILSLSVLILLMLLLVFVVPIFSPSEIDAIGVVSRVVDGDTFELSSGARVRLADVDAPESWESGYSQSKAFLQSLVYGKRVYLDINAVFGTDKYGRLVCVVYVEHSSTHFRNVNKAILMAGYAVISNYPNEFNPYQWSLDCPKTAFVPMYLLVPIFTLIAVSSGIGVVIIFVKERKRILPERAGANDRYHPVKSYPKFRFSNRLADGDYLTLAVWPGKKDPTAEVLTIQIRRLEGDDWITVGRLAVYRTSDGTYSKLS